MRISYFSIDFLAGPTTHTPNTVTHTPSTSQRHQQLNPVPQPHTPLQLRWHIPKFSFHLSPTGDRLSFVMCGSAGEWGWGGWGWAGWLLTACDPICMWFEIDPDFMSAGTVAGRQWQQGVRTRQALLLAAGEMLPSHSHWWVELQPGFIWGPTWASESFSHRYQLYAIAFWVTQQRFPRPGLGKLFNWWATLGCKKCRMLEQRWIECFRNQPHKRKLWNISY